MRSDIGEGYYRTIFGNGIYLLGSLKHLMERDGRDVERLVEPVVVEIIIGSAFANVRTHTDGVEHEVDLSAQKLLRFNENVLQIVVVSGVGSNNRCVDFLG